MVPPMAAPRSSKQAAGEAAVRFVKNGMVLGLGTGSTVEFFLQALARRVDREGLQVIGVPTSSATAARAEELGIPLTTLEHHMDVDLAVDGADEVDPEFRLIKGGGGALLREKIVAASAEKVVIVVGAGKRVARLGTSFLLPVEVTPFGQAATRRLIERAGKCKAFLRTAEDGGAFLTDNGNYILDCKFQKGIANPLTLHRKVSEIPGVVEIGLFLDLCDVVVEGREDGEVVIHEKKARSARAGA